MLAGAETVAIAHASANAPMVTGGLAELRVFATPSEDLAAALNRLARQAGYNLIVPTELVVGRRGPPLRGRMSFDEALRRLLAPAGLNYRLAARTVILVYPVTPPSLAATAPIPAGPASFPPSADVETVVVVGHVAPNEPDIERLLNDDLRRLGVTDSAGLTPAVASLNASPTGPGLVRLSLRGVYGAGDATVPITFGETPIAGPAGTSADPGLFDPELDLTDVSRVDIYKGPQGTDGGVASIAGRVAIRPAAPQIGERTLAVSTAITAVQHGGVGATATLVANVPLDPTTALRAVGYAREIPGYVDDVRLGVRNGNRQDLGGLRFTLRRRLDDRFDASASAVWQSTRTADGSDWSTGLGRYRSDRAVRSPASKMIALAQGNLTMGVGRQDIAVDSAIYRLRVDRAFDDTFVVAAAAGDESACGRFAGRLPGEACTGVQRAAFLDFVADHVPAELHHQGDVTALVSQLLARRRMDRGDVRYGLFLETRTENYTSEVRALTGAPEPEIGARRLRATYTQMAAFGEATLEAGPIRLTSGARYGDVRRVTENNVLTPNPLSGLVASTPRTGAHDAGLSFRERAELELSGTRTYIQVARGWRPGGVNTVPVAGQDFGLFRRDALTTYEAGLGGSLLHGRLELTADVFLTRWRDMQYRLLAANGAFAYVVNAGEVRVRGAELLAIATPAPGWSLRAGGSFSDSRLAGAVSQDLQLLEHAAAGDRLPDIPRAKGFLSLVRQQALPRGWTLETSAQLSARSSIGSQFSTSSPLYLRSHATATLDLGFNLKSAEWMVALDIRNLTDATAVTRAILTRQTPAESFSAAPRAATLSLRRTF